MNRIARWARAEWGALYLAVRTPLVRRSRRAAPMSAVPMRLVPMRLVPMTLAAVCLTSVTQVVQNQSWGYQPVQNLGAVRAQDALWLAVLRTPLSLFVPALDLPVWGALAQLLLVFGVAELCLGWWRTLVIAYAATLAGTLYARVGIALGPDNPFGLPVTDARIVDTGPSAAVVGLAVFLGWRYRARATAAAVVVAMVVEVLLKNNLAGKEHLAAIGAVVALCACRRGARQPDDVPPPPMGALTPPYGTERARRPSSRPASPPPTAGARPTAGRGDTRGARPWPAHADDGRRTSGPTASPAGPAE